ncbi:MAG: HD domain-containing protein, partial [Candidatus Thermoplasmatota archaeon]|nr:HD domain-containing protein [Candidatus Thermoplasmatota archaeon]
MGNHSKTIRDSIHGNIKIGGVFLDLLGAPEIQRLHNVKQLGLAQLVFPGAHHTRLEHSLGAYNMALKASEMLNLDESESELVTCAALLHDVGHGPFSHTLEAILRNSLDVDHVDLTERLLFGEYEIFDSKEKEFISSPSVHEILSKNNINQRYVADIIKGKMLEYPYLSQLLDSAIDVDQLDYLIRDAYYTGVAYGMIDIERFIQTLVINDDRLAIARKGVGVVENILMARTLMYSSVYFHKTVRIAELMLSKSIEMIPNAKPFDFFKMTDAELVNDLKNEGPFQNEIVTYLKYRVLFKQAYLLTHSNLDEQKNEIVKSLEDVESRKEKEREIEDALNIPSGHIIIDVPYRELHQSEPRIDQT